MLASKLAEKLAQRRTQQLYRTRRTLSTPQGPEIIINGLPILSFCSNDYLGLAADPRLIDALNTGAATYGIGSGAAHLLSGHMRPHQELEQALAAFVNRPRALLFSTGYMANLGVITALLGRSDTLWEDRLNHASLIDGGVLSRAKLHRYPHKDHTILAQRLLQSSKTQSSKTNSTLIATDGVFSMDGDLAPLPELATIAHNHNAWLLVDDAHGLGVLGATGRGVLEHYGLTIEQVPILMGTLGKAFGVFGAFVAGSELLIETLIQQARSFIYTTALPPAIAYATLESLHLVETEHWRRQYLATLITELRQQATQLNLPIMESTTPIQPLLVGSTAKANLWSQELESQGILVPAIRPPTVPTGQARLRISLTALHTSAHIERLIDALARLATLKPEYTS
ncbi:8-amino-7-oxononanoate synthase [Achromatium sp. WMS3]|nr:8-amino-7-oxononanoate synthase [Achromatium sp. WMS3]